MNLNDLGREIHNTAKEKGWYEGGLHVPEKIALMHSELSEALECFRSGDMVSFNHNGKPEGFPIEIADTIIRILDLCAAMGIDIDAAVKEKMDYNKTRPYRHGGKRA
jgi:hypothetical protein